jgi:hypothetical protein
MNPMIVQVFETKNKSNSGRSAGSMLPQCLHLRGDASGAVDARRILAGRVLVDGEGVLHLAKAGTSAPHRLWNLRLVYDRVS